MRRSFLIGIAVLSMANGVSSTNTDPCPSILRRVGRVFFRNSRKPKRQAVYDRGWPAVRSTLGSICAS